MADLSDIKVQITLTIEEMRQLVALLNLGAETFGDEAELPEVVHEVSGLYFELMENLKNGYLGEFEPE